MYALPSLSLSLALCWAMVYHGYIRTLLYNQTPNEYSWSTQFGWEPPILVCKLVYTVCPINSVWCIIC